MPRRPISTTITKARARATRGGWNPALIVAEVDARAVLDGGCYFDEAPAARVVKFFAKVLRLEDTSAGVIRPFRLLPWQEVELIRPLFGWRRADGTRRFRRGGIWIPKKNGKSTLAAGIELYMLVGDQEPGAEVYSAANDRMQAGIIHGQAVKMVEMSPVLLTRIGEKGIIRSTKTIYDRDSGSTFKALSADAPTKEGFNISGLVVDEIHAMKSRVLWDTLIYGGAARRQPLMLSISTAGVFDVMSIGWEQYDYAKKIADGTNELDWAFFALIYEAAQKADWTSPAVWKAANPSYGLTVKVDALREECVEAQAEPKKQNNFQRYRLNQWVQQATRWISTDLWQANDVHPVSRDELIAKRGLAYGGLDIGSVSDITAAVLLCECPHDQDAFDLLCRFWVPEDAITDQRNRNRYLYEQWQKQGLLATTPGRATDYDFVEADLLIDAKEFDIKALGIDRLFQGQQVSNHLMNEGMNIVAVGQGFLGQGPPMKELERRLKRHQIHHGAHPILNWMANNVEVKQDPAGNEKMVKPNNRNDPRKIDGMAALVNAIDQVARRGDESEPEYQMIVMGGNRA